MSVATNIELQEKARDRAGLIAGAALILEFALIGVTFYVLSSAIQWPTSLRDPASIALPRLLANEGAVMVGYGSYLIAALLFLPITSCLNIRLASTGWLPSCLVGLAVLSAFAKAIGISRWLFVMPQLARAFASPGNDRSAVTVVFDALNDYAGGIGEALGVGLASGFWTIFVAVLLTLSGERGGRFVGWLGIFSGFLLFLVIPPSLGFPLGSVLTLSNIVWQLWLLLVGIFALRFRPTKRTAGGDIA